MYTIERPLMAWRGRRSEHQRIHFQYSLQWRHNGCDGVFNHRFFDCLFNRFFRCRSKRTSQSQLSVTGLWKENSLVTGEFPSQTASNARNVSIWRRHHVWQFGIFWTTHIRIKHKNIAWNFTWYKIYRKWRTRVQEQISVLMHGVRILAIIIQCLMLI